MAMGVDFNGLRKNLCNSFDEVVRCASQCRKEYGNDPQFQELADALDQHRMFVAGVALCYDEHGNKDVLGDRTLLSMNEDEEEEAPFAICECGRPINECAVMDGGDQHQDRR